MILLRIIRVEMTAKISTLVKEELLSRFAILYNQDSSSDFDLKCGTKVFHVHKVVPASRSDAFKDMFKEESLGENKKTQATIEDCELETLSHLLEFMYKGRLQD
jgi:hypothetical protein